MSAKRNHTPDAAELAPPDFAALNAGSLVILWPKSEAATAWCSDNLPDDCPRWCGNGYAIEARYWPDIEQGISDAGLTGSSA